MLQCPNYDCQASNAESSQFCHQCQTPLPKRYLWAVGLEPDRLRMDELLDERYRYRGSQVLLDLKPAVPPAMPSEVPFEALPYLHLADYRLHLPQVYGWVETAASQAPLLLLSDAAIYRPSVYTSNYPTADQSFGSGPKTGANQAEAAVQSGSPIPLPQLKKVWAGASSWQRLNWLWQIAQLWQPLQREQVVSSLLHDHLLRMEGAVVRLLELRRDSLASPSGTASPALPQLGQLLQNWIEPGGPDSRFFSDLCRHLIEGKIDQPSQLVGLLEGAIAQLSPARSQSIQWVSQTDQGPSRSRNEDACFPPSGTAPSYFSYGVDARSSRAANTESKPDDLEDSAADQPVLIVCDGIGGHQGGDVASQLAIHSVCDHLIEQSETHAPLEIFQQLSDAVYDANDLISHRNDDEQRRNRQRMGTTLVMALVDDYQCYISHVGDSRAYWITPWGCHQITLDDDVASREVRLGQTIYPYALSQPSAGSLVQALGMADSASLHPTVQRLILDGSGLLLLCSDGLSDNDLVELFWQSILLPVLVGEKAIADASQELVTLANAQNGYDNVTVGLMLWQVTPPAPSAAKGLSVNVPPARPTAASTRLQLNDNTAPSTAGNFDRKRLSPEDDPSAKSPETSKLSSVTPVSLKTDLRRSAGLGSLLAGIVILLGLAGLLVYALVPSIGSRFRRVEPSSPDDVADSPQPLPDDVNSTEGVPDSVPLTVGSVLRAGGGSPNTSSIPTYVDPSALTETDSAAAEPAEAMAEAVPVGNLASGAVVEILGRSEFAQSTQWVELRVCALPAEAAIATLPTAETLLQPGEAAWLLETSLTSFGLQPVAEDRSSVCPASAN